MAHATSKASRRAILGRGSVGLLASAAVALTGHAIAAAASAAGGDDAELVRLYSELVAAVGKMRAIEQEDLPDGITPQSEDQERRLAEAVDAFWEIAENIIDTPATVQTGMRAKAESLRLVLEQAICTDVNRTVADIESGVVGYAEDRLGWSLARDAMAWGTAA
jgi:hypothetical protein